MEPHRLLLLEWPLMAVPSAVASSIYRHSKEL